MNTRCEHPLELLRPVAYVLQGDVRTHQVYFCFGCDQELWTCLEPAGGERAVPMASTLHSPGGDVTRAGTPTFARGANR